MQALLSLSSYLHSVDSPSSPARLQNPNIAVTTLEYFTASLVNASATDHQDSGERDRRAKIWDLKFLRQLLTLWTTDWDGLSELDQLIEKLQVCSPKKMYYWIYLYPELRSLLAARKNDPTTMPPLSNSTYCALRSY